MRRIKGNRVVREVWQIWARTRVIGLLGFPSDDAAFP